MSFRKYGGTNKLEKNNNITVHSIVADTFTIRDAFLSVFTIEGDLQIGGNGIISNNLTVSQQINATTLDISSNATIEGILYLDKMNDVFFRGNNQMVGLNTSNPTATLDISSNKVQTLNLKTSAANNRNIIARNFSNNGIAVVATGTTESGIQFYSANTGTIDVSNAQGAMIKYSNTDSLLSLDSTGGDVKVTSKMIITDNTTNGNAHTSFGETVLIYDKDNGGSQPVFFNEAYGNTTVKTGSAVTIQSINNASNTFLNITTPNQLGIQIGGGSYPKDPTRSMGIIDVYHPEIDVDATPAMMVISGNSLTKFNSTTGFNTFQPKYNNYAVDINGPLHLNNGEVKKTIETTMRITKLSNFGSSYGIAIGGEGVVDGSIRYFTYTTNNGGKSWTRQNALTSTDVNSSIESGAQIYKSVYSYSATRTIIGGTGSSLWVTDNGATNWYQLFITGGILTINAIYTPLDISKNFVYIGGDTGGGNATIRYGYIEPFTYTYTGFAGNPTATRYRYNDVSYNYPITDGIISNFSGFGQNFLAVGGNKIRKFDLGVSKMELTLTSTYTNTNDVTYNAVRLADANNGVAVGGNVISYTKNGGTSWATANIPSLSGKTFNDVFLDGSMNAIVVGNNGYIYSSNDGYYTWKIVDEDVLNASGVGSRITDTTNDITSVFMPDSSTIILSIVKNNDSNAKYGKLYYLNMPNIFNNKRNFLFDVSGCIRMSGDLIISQGGEIKSSDSTFNLLTTDVLTLNAATNALSINMGGTNTTNIAIGGANTTNLLAGGINTGNVIIGGNVTTSKIGPLNISSLTNGNVTLSNDLVTGNVYANSIVLTNNLDVTNGILRVNSTNNSTSATTGSLVVHGGLGIAKDIYSAGNIYSLRDINLSGNLYSTGNALVMTSLDNITASIAGNSIVYTSNTGTLQIGGGTAISKNIYIGGTTFCGGDLVVQGQISYLGGTVSTSTTFSSAIVASPLRGNSNQNIDYNYLYSPLDPPTTYNNIGFGAGALTTEGGFAVALDSWLIGSLRVDGANNLISRTVESSSAVTGALQIRGGVGIGMNVNIGGNTIIYSSVESTSTNSGALQIRGGVGIGGNVYTGGNVIVNSTIESVSTSTGAIKIIGGVGIGRNANIGGNVIINSTIESTSTNTGALQIIGGVGIGGNVYTGGNVIINNITESNSTVTGALQIRGGVGIGRNLYTGGNVIINSTIESISINTGALQIIGGVGIGRNANIGGNVIINSTIESTSTNTGALQIIGGVGIGGNVYTGGNVIINNITESNSTVTGALQIRGGVGIGRNLYTGGNVIINSTIESTSINTGALRIIGGVGIGGNVYTGGNVIINSTIESNDTVTGALQIIGGVGIGRNTNIGGNVIINSTSESNNTITGALQIMGGASIGRNLYTGGNVIINSTIESNSTVTGAFQIRGGVGIGMNTNIGGNVIIHSSIESTSISTGALQIIGGVGIGGNTNIGGNVNIGKKMIVLDTTDSVIPTLAALQVRGGMSVEKKIVSGSLSTGPIGATNLALTSSDVCISTNTGALQVTGGIGVGGSINTGGNIIVNSSIQSTSTNSGALQVKGGVGIAKNLHVANTIYTNGLDATGEIRSGSESVVSLGGTLNVVGASRLANTTITGGLNVTSSNVILNVMGNNVTFATSANANQLRIGGSTGVFPNNIDSINNILYVNYNTNNHVWFGSGSTNVGIKGSSTISGSLIVQGGTPSTSTVTGALIVSGGVGIGGNLNVGGTSRLANTSITGTLQASGGTTLSGGLVVTGEKLIVSGVTNNITATGNSESSYNNLTASGGGGSYNQLTAGSGSYNYITAVTGGENKIQGSTIFQDYDSVASGVIIENRNGLVVMTTAHSTSTSTGALQVRGGVGIGGNIIVGGMISGSLNAVDNRTVSQNSLSLQSATFGFGTFNNNNTGGYADFIHFNTYSDSTGGVPNLLVLSKSGFGMRIFQPASYDQSSSTAYTDYRNVVLSNQSGNVTIEGSLSVVGGTTLGGTLNVVGASRLTNTSITGTLQASRGTTLSGGLVVTGGSLNVASGTTLGGTLNVVGASRLTNTTPSTSTVTGALIVSGGVGIGGNLYVGGTSRLVNTTITGTLQASGGTTLSGGLVVTGAKLIVSGVTNNITATGNSTSSYNILNASGGGGSYNQLTATGGSYNYITAGSTSYNYIQGSTIFQDSNIFASGVTIENRNGLVVLTTAHSTSSLTGALIVSGGVGIGGNLNIGGTSRLVNTTITGALYVGGGFTSDSTATGTVRIIGGLGVSGNINAGAMVTAPIFNATSDRRIKKDITDLNCPSLEIMRKIRPREYTMIDGNKESVYGFIAQEVKEIIPKSIYLQKGYIPSVYENAFVNGNIITLINKTTTDISCCKLKLRNKNNEDIIVNVTSIHDNKTFSINADIKQSTLCMDICGTILDTYIQNGVTTYMRGSQVYTGEVKQGIFVYGSQVDDFHTINKDTIWTVTLSATQEMDVQLQEARRTIRELEERIASIERRLS